MFHNVEELDLFAGIGGWEALRPGRGIGVETDKAARATRRAAGLHTIQADVRAIGMDLFPRARKLRGSPPCQTFAQSGNGAGVQRLLEVAGLAQQMRARQPVDFTGLDERTGLVLQPLRFILEAMDLGRPFESIALEQVPRVLPFWQEMASILSLEGYHVYAGVLNAEQYGTPQARQRAVLEASLVHPVGRPEPTHSQYHRHDATRLDPGVLPYVTMADALTWGDWSSIDEQTFPHWCYERPATTLVASFAPHIVSGPGYRKHDGPSRQNAPGSVEITLDEGLLLQSFPAGWPLQGSRSAQWKQIGNAIPPLMADAIRREVE